MGRTGAFKRAIDCIGKGDLDYKAVAVVLAQTNPAAFCKAVLAVRPDQKWKAIAEELFRQGKKINAIKLIRGETGMGLKEAKGAIEYFEQYGYWEGK